MNDEEGWFDMSKPGTGVTSLGKIEGSCSDELIQLYYPAIQKVTPAKIMGWHADMVANGEIDEATDDLEQAIRDLEDIGWITAGRRI